MPEPVLEARQIVKRFGRVQALRGANLTVYPRRSSRSWATTVRARARW